MILILNLGKTFNKLSNSLKQRIYPDFCFRKYTPGRVVQQPYFLEEQTETQSKVICLGHTGGKTWNLSHVNLTSVFF